MSRLLWLGVCAALISFACGDSGGPEPAAAVDGRPPVVLLVVIDTLRADHLSQNGYGRPTSPHLDALGAASTAYTRAYAQAPWTSASVGSLLSSRYPSEIGVTAYGNALPEDLALLSERLEGAGYASGAIVSHDFVASKWGFAQGFDHFDERFVQGPQAVTSEGISQVAVEWIDAHAEQPFFLFLHYFDPHYAYTAHEEFDFRDPDYRGWFRSGMTLPDIMTPEHPFGLSDADLDQVRRIYDSEIAHTDREIGRVLDALRERELFDDALIVVTADHGEEFLDHGLLNHTKTLYDELVHVPLIIHYPGAPPARVETNVALIDVYPTILDVLGLPPGAGLRGRSLVGVTNDTRPRPVFIETTFGQDLHGERRVRNLRAVVFGRHKLIAEAGDATHPPRAELYDLAEDPSEKSPLGDEHPAMERLAPMLSRWISANVPAPGRAVELDRAERERLEALGYLPDTP